MIVKVCFTRSFAFTITLNSDGSLRSLSCPCINAPCLPDPLQKRGILRAPLKIKARRRQSYCCFVACGRDPVDCHRLAAAHVARRAKLREDISDNARQFRALAGAPRQHSIRCNAAFQTPVAVTPSKSSKRIKNEFVVMSLKSTASSISIRAVLFWIRFSKCPAASSSRTFCKVANHALKSFSASVLSRSCRLQGRRTADRPKAPNFPYRKQDR